MKAKKERGPMMYEEFDPRASTQEKKATIRCTNRLSKFNLMAFKMRAKNENRIESFQLHNGTFRLKKKDSDHWIMINTEAELSLYEKSI